MSSTIVPARRWAWAEIDLDALEHNVSALRATVAPAQLWAVVKADGYGHGAGTVARSALAAGASALCVALVDEGVELREEGIDAPILVLSEQPREQLDALVDNGLAATVYTHDTVKALARIVDARAGRRPVAVHVKVDTGMQRVGSRPDEVADLVDAVLATGGSLRLAGIATHLATADEPNRPTTNEQLDVFDVVVDDALRRVRAAGLDADEVVVHAANSAGGLAHPRARRGAVRAGIAMYGISPGPGVDHLTANLQPVMRLAARVSYVKPVAAGSKISYGHRHTFGRATTVATVPIGYADGVPRRLWSTGGGVLVGGRRCPVVGVVTMDALMVDVGELPVAVGDEVVLLGAQGAERIRAEEWAERLDTIGYEVVCGVSRRIERVPGRNIGA